MSQKVKEASFLNGPKESKNFLFVLRYIIGTLQLGGLLPIFVVHSKYNIGPATWCKSMYSNIVRALLLTSMIINVTLFCMGNHFQGAAFGFGLFMSIHTFLQSFCLCVCAYNGSQIVEIFNNLLSIDEELQQYHQLVICHNSALFTKMKVLCLILHACSILTFLAFLCGCEVESYIMTTTFELFSFNFIAYIILVSALLEGIAKRFALLNGMLYKYSYAYSYMQSVLFVSSSDMFAQDVLFVFRTHNKLLRILKDFNEYCNYVLVMWMAFIFIEITYALHMIAVEIATNNAFIVFDLTFVYILSYIIPLIMLCYYSEFASNEANNTIRVLSKVYGQNEDDKDLIDRILTKNIKQKAKFTAYGFYVINKSTLFKIFSAVTTYLVILIQFKQLEETQSTMPRNELATLMSNKKS